MYLYNRLGFSVMNAKSFTLTIASPSPHPTAPFNLPENFDKISARTSLKKKEGLDGQLHLKIKAVCRVERYV
jgi:hypothetical protein